MSDDFDITKHSLNVRHNKGEAQHLGRIVPPMHDLKPIERDVLELLEKFVGDPTVILPAARQGDVNVFADPVEVPRSVIRNAIKEIRWLRSMAGAVSGGDTFVELRLYKAKSV